MKTILLVDDEYALVEILTELLQDEGYRVVSSANGKDGLTRVQQEKPDLVVTDFMMPIAGGFELIRGMRALPEFRSTPVVLTSAVTKTVALSGLSVPLDVSEFIRKPFHWNELLTAIVRLIGDGGSKRIG